MIGRVRRYVDPCVLGQEEGFEGFVIKLSISKELAEKIGWKEALAMIPGQTDILELSPFITINEKEGP